MHSWSVYITFGQLLYIQTVPRGLGLSLAVVWVMPKTGSVCRMLHCKQLRKKSMFNLIASIDYHSHAQLMLIAVMQATLVQQCKLAAQEPCFRLKLTPSSASKQLIHTLHFVGWRWMNLLWAAVLPILLIVIKSWINPGQLYTAVKYAGQFMQKLSRLAHQRVAHCTAALQVHSTAPKLSAAVNHQPAKPHLPPKELYECGHEPDLQNVRVKTPSTSLEGACSNKSNLYYKSRARTRVISIKVCT
jgi:hypothetical protein